MARRVRFRQSFATVAAAVFALIGSVALGAQRWWLTPIMLVPLAAVWWSVRSGVDVTADGVRVRRPFGSRTVGWDDVAGFSLDRRRVLLGLTNGNTLTLPAVTQRDLPYLVEAGGGWKDGAGPEDEGDPEDETPPKDQAAT